MLSGGPHVTNSLLSFHFHLRPNWADTKTVGLTEISLRHLIHFPLLLYNQTKEMISLPYFSLLFASLLPFPNIALVFEFEFADLAVSTVSCWLPLIIIRNCLLLKIGVKRVCFFPRLRMWKLEVLKGKQQRNFITFKCSLRHPNVILKYKLLLSSRILPANPTHIAISVSESLK